MLASSPKLLRTSNLHWDCKLSGVSEIHNVLIITSFLIARQKLLISPQLLYNDGGGGGGGGGTLAEVSVLSLWTDTGTLFVGLMVVFVKFGITRCLGGFIKMKS